MDKNKLQGFKELHVKNSDSSLVTHVLYIRPHSVRKKIDEKPPERTLFVVGVPPYINEKTLEEFFKSFGRVHKVYIHKNPSAQVPPIDDKFFPIHEPIRGYKVAYIVFKDQAAMKNVLQNDNILTFPKVEACGLEKWINNYNNEVPDIPQMEAEIRNFMREFDHENNERKRKDKSLSQADDEGWVTVTKRGRRPGFSRKESVRNQLLEKDAKQQKKKQLTDFYRFQIKESKMKNLVALRQKFEEDKKKIAALKATRKFKPF